MSLKQTATANQTNADSSNSCAVDLPALPRRKKVDVGFPRDAGRARSGKHIVTSTSSETSSPYSVQFSAFPASLQLFPRNRTTNTAAVSVAGTEVAGGFTQAVLRVYRNGTQVGTDQVQALNYTGGSAPFSFMTTITAELAEYKIELLLRDGMGQEFVVQSADNVVAGDVFIIEGQSNATTFPSSTAADGYMNEFVRTFGSGSEDPNATLNVTSWFVANGQGSSPDGSLDALGAVGQWGLVLGNRLMTENGVPVTILNGAHGGSPISYFQRNETDPADLSTNYGRLLYRMQQSGLVGAVRSILYFQGESDLGNAAQYETGFVSLHADWLEDYASTERLYVFQLREGCGVSRFDLDLRNRQRLFTDEFPDVSVMSTNGLDSHDGCHFGFSDGYEEIGLNIARMVQRDLYGGPSLASTDAPNPASAAVISGANHDHIKIPLRNITDTVTFEPGAQSDFAVVGASVSVLSGTVSDGVLDLQLSDSAANATAVMYTGHSGDGGQTVVGKWVANANGIGLLSFTVPIVADTPPVITLLGANPLVVGVGETFVDPGATAMDVADGDLTAQIAVGGGTIRISYVCNTPYDEGLLSGVEVWQAHEGPPPTTTFYRAINLGGPAMTINGNNWEANTGSTTNFTVVGTAAGPNTVTFNPPPGAYEPMLHTFRYGTGLHMALTHVPSGSYDVYVWADEDGPSSVNATLSINGLTVLGSYNTGATGHWDRLGPYRVTLNGGPVVTTAPGTFTLTYNVSDSAGNEATPVTRTVKVVDQTAPVITLLGENPIEVNVGATFVDPGATALDNVDGDLTGQIAVSGGPVDTSVPGDFTLTYNVSDIAGNTATQVTRTVHVNPNGSPTADPQSCSTNEDTPLPITLTGSDPETIH